MQDFYSDLRYRHDSKLACGSGCTRNRPDRSTFNLSSELSQGWKPNLVEDGGRDDVDRMNGPMSPARQQLALAEAMSFGVAEAVFVENAFATGLWNEAPQAVAELMAIGNYNHFFANHVEYYVGTRSVAPTAVVFDDSSNGVGLLNGSGARNVTL